MKTFAHVALAALAFGSASLAQASTAAYSANFALEGGLPRLLTGNPNFDGPDSLDGRWTTIGTQNAEVRSRDLLSTSIDADTGAVVQNWGNTNYSANKNRSSGPPLSMGQSVAHVPGAGQVSQTSAFAGVNYDRLTAQVEQNTLLSESTAAATWQRGFSLDAHSSFTFSGIATLGLGGDAGPLDAITTFDLGAGSSFASLTLGDVLGRVRTSIGATISDMQAGLGNIFSYSQGPNGLLSLTITNNGDSELRGSLTAGSYVSVAAPVPEPEVWASMLLGLGLMGSVLRKRAKTATA
ncbi:PEP-CTERM sorting domain-containing protein [Rhizobacter sp. Root1221]|uniref:PEP-CTERM sorting domain-containing protein n=1 Tax=Rhizobacter sp. Root1221 TaxID=1736433 RepID=UPI0006F5786B|nr:PEP-CTERM sorting domain-containing protein [Rhizobacter sp. Root1221]